VEMANNKSNVKCPKCGYEWRTRSKLRMVTCPSCNKKVPNKPLQRRIMRRLVHCKRAIVGLEAAIVLIAFVIIAAAFAFMVINQGLYATERGKTVIQEGLKQSSTPLIVDGTIFIRTTPEGGRVNTIIIPVKAYGVKYVAASRDRCVVILRVGNKAWANAYGGIMYASTPSPISEDIVLSNRTVGSFYEYTGNLTGTPVAPGTLNLTVKSGQDIYILRDDGRGRFQSPNLTITSSSIDYSLGMFRFQTNVTLDKESLAEYLHLVEGEMFDPTGFLFDSFVGAVYNNATRNFLAWRYTGSQHGTSAILAITHTNGDETLDSSEKAYLIITLADSDVAFMMDEINVEIRLEQSATLSIEFKIPASMPPNSYLPA